MREYAISELDEYLHEVSVHPLLTAAEEVALARQCAAGRRAGHQMTTGSSLLPVQQEQLRAQIDEGECARQRLIESNLRLVVSIARRYQGHGLALLDLIQEGNIGLQIGVDRFDWRRGYRLSTYVYWWIRQAIMRALANQARLIRIPVHAGDMIRKASSAEQQLQAELGREPTLDEIAERVGTQPNTLQRLRTIAGPLASLDVPVSDDAERTRGDTVADDDAFVAVNSAGEAAELCDEVAGALELLPDRERDVLCLRFGIAGADRLTLAEIGERLGVTRQRAQQLEGQALRRLRANARLRRRLAS